MSDSCALPKFRSILQRGLDQGLHPGAQWYVSVSGEIIDCGAIGQAQPGIPMDGETLMLWLSAGKPLLAVGLAILKEKGELAWRDSVSRFIPEFACGGKENLTLWHLLTHTGGFREVDILRVPEHSDEYTQEVCRSPLEPSWIPGETAGYHMTGSWHVLGEVIRKVSGKGYSEWIREHLFEPLGMIDSWVGMPWERYHLYSDRLGWMYETGEGKSVPHAHLNNRVSCTGCSPGSNARGPIRELGLFYEMLRAGGEWMGKTIISRESVQELTGRQREGKYDKTFRQVVDWGLGFLLNSNQYDHKHSVYGYGSQASSQTFGHSGAQSSCAFCDPVRKLVVAWVCNGRPGELFHQKRALELNTALYEDLS